MVKTKTQLSRSIRLTKKEISAAGHVLQDKIQRSRSEL